MNVNYTYNFKKTLTDLENFINSSTINNLYRPVVGVKLSTCSNQHVQFKVPHALCETIKQGNIQMIKKKKFLKLYMITNN